MRFIHSTQKVKQIFICMARVGRFGDDDNNNNNDDDDADVHERLNGNNEINENENTLIHRHLQQPYLVRRLSSM